jgi:hypothetical protein
MLSNVSQYGLNSCIGWHNSRVQAAGAQSSRADIDQRLLNARDDSTRSAYERVSRKFTVELKIEDGTNSWREKPGRVTKCRREIKSILPLIPPAGASIARERLIVLIETGGRFSHISLGSFWRAGNNGHGFQWKRTLHSIDVSNGRRQACKRTQALEERAVQRDRETAELSARLSRGAANFARLAATIEAILVSSARPSPAIPPIFNSLPSPAPPSDPPTPAPFITAAAATDGPSAAVALACSSASPRTAYRALRRSAAARSMPWKNFALRFGS